MINIQNSMMWLDGPSRRMELFNNIVQNDSWKCFVLWKGHHLYKYFAKKSYRIEMH